MGATFDVATAGAVVAAFLAIVYILLVVTKKATAQPEKKKPIAVPVAAKKSTPVVAEKVIVEEVKEVKPDSRPRTPLQAVGRSSATESPRGFQRTKKLD